MARISKYKGGSRLTTFRLPTEGFKSTRARVQALLNEIAGEMKDKGKTTLSPVVASAKTILGIKEVINPIEDNGKTVYVCGCTVENDLFRRAFGCRIARVDHR